MSLHIIVTIRVNQIKFVFDFFCFLYFAHSEHRHEIVKQIEIVPIKKILHPHYCNSNCSQYYVHRTVSVLITLLHFFLNTRITFSYFFHVSQCLCIKNPYCTDMRKQHMTEMRNNEKERRKETVKNVQCLTIFVRTFYFIPTMMHATMTPSKL